MPVADKEGVSALAKYMTTNWKKTSYSMHDLGTPGGLTGLHKEGKLPTRNFQDGQFEGNERIGGEALRDTLLIDRGGCYACPIRCKRVVEVDDADYKVDPMYGGPEYETLGSFGSLCGVDDLRAISKANEICNAYGMDTISAGMVVAFAMECFENELLSADDTDGLELRFGNAKAMVAMVQKIADREGLGDLLAEGSAIAAQKITQLRQLVENETKRRTAEQLGREHVQMYGIPQLSENVEFLRASGEQLRQMRKTVAPLARTLATRLAAKRRRRRAGQIDLRKTLRKSMSTGGVPIDVVLRKPRPARPELVVLCDVSGSVAGFSHFTLQLVHALRQQFSRVRVFAFIDTTDEVTHLFGPDADLAVAVQRITREAGVYTRDGHSDYGHAFVSFLDKYPNVLSPRSSLLVLGDGRNNYRNPETELLTHMVTASRHAHWLNPEPRNLWGSGDSAVPRYEDVITMHECRSAKQLAGVIDALLPV